MALSTKWTFEVYVRKVDDRSGTTNAVRQHNNKLNITMATASAAAASSADAMKLMMNTSNNTSAISLHHLPAN